MKHWIIVGIAILLIFLHERLSATKFWALGSILPLAGVAALVYQYAFAKSHFSAQIIIAYVIFFIVTLLLWVVGRYEYKQKELKRMKAKDID
ncbi:hypothetical protein [Flavonifractor plautii]|uniref:hypothetical protein n=1 Tax=Flavonifractor plautii TaxID=292800 RepID=UPI00214C2F2A|nr:hypothetical protein [Flavonifractor plautii]MCR1920294.1 hypothetical protein [Flavonifractor plautii]